jgi:glycosyltransferase involved in cell wall biosynthesis
MKTLVIIDEDFRTFEGHPYDYNKSVQRMFEKEGFRVIIYGHQEMLPDFVTELGARPMFSFNRKSSIRKVPFVGSILYRLSFWRMYRRQLKRLIGEVSSNHFDYYLFFSNVYWYNILPIARGLRNVKRPAAILYRTSIFDALGQPGFLQPSIVSMVKGAVRLMSKNKNIHYTTDSDVIKEEWEREFNLPMDVLPFPHLARHGNVDKTRAKGIVRLYLPGGMRLEKGAALLTEALELLVQQYPDVAGNVEMVAQFSGKDELLNSFRDRIAALPIKKDLLAYLTTEEYNEQLARADVILLPYIASEGYRARTSGILAEAIASAKPFITTENTWMSNQAEKYNTGIIVKERPADLAAAINQIVKDYSIYAEKAVSALGKWEKNQSEEAFINILKKALRI